MTPRGCPQHGDACTTRATPGNPVDFVVDGWELVRPLGTGGFAQVFVARRVADGRQCALKIAQTPRDPRFSVERECLERLGSPLAPALLAWGFDSAHRPFVAQELLDGESLAEWIARHDGPPPPEQALPLFAKLCDAVDRMHARGVIHRDLKPENVFVRASGEIALIDFGLARLDGRNADPVGDGRLTADGQRIGTTLYASPEQCRGERDVDERTDVYALAVMLFELLTLRPPFVGDEAGLIEGHLLHRPPSPSDLRAELPPALDAVVMRGLAKRRGDRFASAGELSASVAAARAPALASSTAATPQDGPTKRVVALLGIRGDLPVGELNATAAQMGAVLARTAGDLHVLAFPSEKQLGSGLRAAIRAGAALAPLAATRVVHVGELRLRRRASSFIVAGALIEDAAGWCRPTTEPRLLFTDAAAQAMQAGATIASSVAGYHQLVAEQEDAPPVVISAERGELRGRGDLLGALTRDAQRCFETRRPALAVVVGDLGMGKSRILEAIGATLSAQADVITARAIPRQQGSLAEQLLQACDLDGAPSPGEPAASAAESPAVAEQRAARALASRLRASARRRPLAVIVDEGQWADSTALAAIEQALFDDGVPLWVLVGAREQFAEQRSAFGAGAKTVSRHRLAPLGDEDARRLLVDLLRPVEFVPTRVLDLLVRQAAGVPLCLVELVHGLRSVGAIRRQRGTEGWYVAGDELLAVSATPLAQRLVKRMTAGLEQVLIDLLSLCAVFGDEASAHEIADVQLRLRSATPADHADVGIGLERLVATGLLRAIDGGRFAFTSPLLRNAVESEMTPVEASRLHSAVYYWLIDSEERARRLDEIARHAAAAGLRAAASKAYLDLARGAERQHRYVEAEQHYTSALEQLTEGRTREEALTGRGHVRYRSQRFDDAREDLRAARGLAAARGDELRAANLRLDEAIVLDWMSDSAGAAALVAEVVPMMERIDDAALRGRLSLAQGRDALRADQFELANRLLEASRAQAHALGDHETETIALVLLGPSLSAVGRFEEAKARFDEVIALCQRSGDRFHLAVAHGNRVPLWIQTRRYEEARRDLERAMTLARGIANFRVESYSSLNLAMLLFWDDDLERARELSLRALDLERRFEPRPVPDASLLMARIEAARGAIAEAEQYLAAIDSKCTPEQFSPSANIMRQLARFAVAEANGQSRAELRRSWHRLIAERPASALLIGDETLDLLVSATRWAVRNGLIDDARAWIAEAHAVPDGASAWQRQIAELSRALPALA